MNFRPEHLGLAASDANALKNWYVNVLGAKIVMKLGSSPPAYLLDLGGTWIEIYSAESSAGSLGNRVAGWRHLALQVDNIEAACSHLTATGVSFTEPVKPAGGAGRIQFFCDPEGNLLHLVERPKDWPGNQSVSNQ
jgi:glyoxylase I family protein